MVERLRLNTVGNRRISIWARKNTDHKQSNIQTKIFSNVTFWWNGATALLQVIFERDTINIWVTVSLNFPLSTVCSLLPNDQFKLFYARVYISPRWKLRYHESQAKGNQGVFNCNASRCYLVRCTGLERIIDHSMVPVLLSPSRHERPRCSSDRRCVDNIELLFVIITPWHPFHPSITAIFLLQPRYTAQEKKDGLQYHAAFQILAYTSALLGATAIIYNKSIHDKPHITR